MSITSDLPQVEPHNDEAEQAVLGAVLLDNGALDKTRDLLSPDEFYVTAHRFIYRAMVELHTAGVAIDNISLADALDRQGGVANVGGSAYLAELVANCAGATNVLHHARIVAEVARRRTVRRLLIAAKEVIEQGADLKQIEELASRLKAVTSTEKIHDRESLTLAVLGYDELIRAAIPERTLFLPWLAASSITMIFGPRGIGKTMFGAGVAVSLCTGTPFLRWSASDPVGVLYIDGEMSLDALRDRFTRLLPCPPKAPLRFLTAEHVYHILQRDLVLSAEATRDQIVEILDAHPEIKVVVLDNISCLFAGLDEDKKRDWEPVAAWLIRLRHRGLATILVHHAGKGGQQRGTSGREDALDVSIQLDRPADYDSRQGCRFEMRFAKSRGIHGDVLAPLEISLDEHHRFAWALLEVSKEEAARKLYSEGVTRPSDLAEELGITKGYASKLIRKIKQEMA